jgi:hypothetical protein
VRPASGIIEDCDSDGLAGQEPGGGKALEIGHFAPRGSKLSRHKAHASSASLRTPRARSAVSGGRTTSDEALVGAPVPAPKNSPASLGARV